jgi:hypothetical protein
MSRTLAEKGGAGSFQSVRCFLEYVQGDECGSRDIPPGIVRDLLELEERANRVRAITGVMPAVELSPYVVELLKAAGEQKAGSTEGVLNAASA